jgi:hypothetical protein
MLSWRQSTVCTKHHTRYLLINAIQNALRLEIGWAEWIQKRDCVKATRQLYGGERLEFPCA